MTLLVELHGKDVVGESLESVKSLIRSTPATRLDQRETMLREFAAIRGIELTALDFEGIR